MATAGFAAGAWGFADFLAGILSRRLPVVTLLIWSKIAGAVLALIIVAARGVPCPADPRLLLAAIAGLLGLPSMGLLYRAMRDGSPAVVAPIAAVAALVPVGWGFAGGERFGLAGAAGVITALAGATLASWPIEGVPRAPIRPAAAWHALGAALCFGAYFVLLPAAGAVDPYWATAVACVTGGAGAVILALALRRRRAARVSLRAHLGPLTTAGVVGVLETLADASFVLAAGAGTLGLAAMLSSLYPAVTVLLNAYILRERLHIVHGCGVAAALLAIACLAG
ncbi:EamA family transporter [Catenuloplanes japonicus]|uniref:EamA family transporter n=1 Tax=Catenuloplanes japonicus TaxID=33876 RepID=UPI001E2CF5C9|nr:EamA family transporter [Catenuloplanes japonicus]